MTERANFPLLPYTYVVGQRTLCRLLEILPLCLRKEQRVQDQALILLAHVVYPSS